MTGLDHLGDVAHAHLGTCVVHAGIFDVITGSGFLEGVTTVGSHQRITEVRGVISPHDGALAVFLQSLVNLGDLFEGFRRLGQQVLVIDQADGFHGNRVAIGFAINSHGIPCQLFKFAFGGSVRRYRNQQTGFDPLTVTVVSPEEDVRAVASGGGLLEFHFNLIRVSHSNLDAGFCFKLLTHFSQTVVSLVTVDPDGQLAFIDGSSSRASDAKSGQTDQG